MAEEFKTEMTRLGDQVDGKIKLLKDEIERLEAYIERTKCDHEYRPVEYAQVYAIETKPSVHHYRTRRAYRMECSKCGIAGKELTCGEYAKTTWEMRANIEED